MLWKPVVYQSDDRSVENTTLMHVYELQNQVTSDSTDEGIFLSLLHKPYVSALNLSIGANSDGMKNRIDWKENLPLISTRLFYKNKL